MKTHSNHSEEKIKHTIIESGEKSKDAIHEIIDSTTDNMNSALESGKKMVDSITENFHLKGIDNSIGETLKDTVEKSVELGKGALDSIIGSTSKQMEMNVDFSKKFVEAISQPHNDPAKLMELIHKNVEASQHLAEKNTKVMMDLYNKQINLVVNFNQKIADSMKAQMGSFSHNIQDMGSKKFSGMAPEWWKQFSGGKN